MKALETAGMRVVHAGADWRHPSLPCTRETLALLEHNEGVVSWLQPADGSVEDQVAALRVGGAYYRLSLRMMKAVWRHVRLRKGFVNREAAPYGGQKLRIPRLLFMEKMRTQSRFNQMRMSRGEPKDRKQVQNASHKIWHVVQRVLLPLLAAPGPPVVSFRPDDGGDHVRGLLELLRASEPEALADRDSFVAKMGSLYDATYVIPDATRVSRGLFDPSLTTRTGTPAASPASP